MSDNITKVQIRMYRMGTGDCFVLRFLKGNSIKFKMMIDAGVWQKGKDHITPYVEDLKDFVNNEIDVLVVTHEHMDHVLAFQRCEELFTNDFEVKQVWMGWTEKDGDPKVEKWKTDFGEKKKALAMAAHVLNHRVNSDGFDVQFKGNFYEKEMLGIRKNQATVIEDFAELNTDFERKHDEERNQLLSVTKVYKGALKGMSVVKNDMKVDRFRYFKPGEIVDNIANLPGLKFYILGPPELHKEVELESGGPGETFGHSHNLDDHMAFADAVNTYDEMQKHLQPDYHIKNPKYDYPFDEKFIMSPESESRMLERQWEGRTNYEEEAWRKIDHDWLYSSGNLALRMNSLTNNLSLAFAIEVEDTGEVLLFPGDAEYGSWSSWHAIDWGNAQQPDKKHLTEDLLNRTIFYKVAHHMSHNGTAKSKGIDMMTSDKLSAMVTLDYDVISKGWKNTMPNRFILDELLLKTRGRLIFSNEDNIPYHNPDEEIDTLGEKIEKVRKMMDSNERQEFNTNFKSDPNGLWHQLTIKF